MKASESPDNRWLSRFDLVEGAVVVVVGSVVVIVETDEISSDCDVGNDSSSSIGSRCTDILLSALCSDTSSSDNWGQHRTWPNLQDRPNEKSIW